MMGRSQRSDSIPRPEGRFVPRPAGRSSEPPSPAPGAARLTAGANQVPALRSTTRPPADHSDHADLAHSTEQTEHAPRGHGFATVLRNKYFLRLWMAQLISQTVMNATNYGLLTLITKEHRSLLATGGAVVAFSLPALLFGAPAGVVVDRFDRRTVLWVSNALRALVTLIFVGSLLLDPRALVPAYLLTFLIAVIGQFFGPAEGAAIPRLVHKRELINALALFNITFTMSQAAGLIVLGPLMLLLVPQFRIGTAHHGVEILPVESLLVIVALLYVVCTFLILSIPKRKLASLNPNDSAARIARQGKQLRGVLRSIGECAHYIAKDPRLAVVVWQLSLAGVFTSVIAMIAPRFVTEFFDKQPEAAALVFMPAGIGLVIGSAFTPNITRRLGHGKTVSLGVLALGGCTGAITLVHFLATQLDPKGWPSSLPYLALMLFLTFMMGIALDFINVPAQAMMQALSPDWIKGRVLAVQIMLFNAVTIPVVLVIGRLGDVFGLSAALLLISGAVLVAGGVSVVVWRLAVHRERHTGSSVHLDSPDFMRPHE